MKAAERQREERKRTAYYEDDITLPPEADALCPFRPCYHKTESQGAYTAGTGYSSYHEEFRPVCGTRRDHGCPAWRNEVDDEVHTGRAIRWAVKTLRATQGKGAQWANRQRKFAFTVLEMLSREGGRLG